MVLCSLSSEISKYDPGSRLCCCHELGGFKECLNVALCWSRSAAARCCVSALNMKEARESGWEGGGVVLRCAGDAVTEW